MLWSLVFSLGALARDTLIVQSDFGAERWGIGSESWTQSPGRLLEAMEAWDVVDVMKLTGHGEGLDEVRRIRIFGEDSVRSVTEGDKLRLKKEGKSFMDVTDHPDLGNLNAERLRISGASGGLRLVDDIAPKEEILSMFDGIDDTHLREDITTLTSFWNRNYRSPWGLRSSNWIHDTVQDLLNSTAHPGVTTSVRKFAHSFIQNTIIATIEASGDNTPPSEKELVIVGAHQDSLNYLLPFYRAPGADDDGSGTVTHLQILRTLMERRFIPPPSIRLEFHWYAAEEGGLLGSQDVAAAYEKDGANVRGMLQMDMVAFLKNDTTPIVGLFGDQVDENLTTFTTKLVDAYLPIGWEMTGCGKTCGSDHMSWHQAGFRSAFVTEGLFADTDSFIHTSGDDLDAEGQYNFDHMLQFVKLGIAWVTELSALSNSD